MTKSIETTAQLFRDCRMVLSVQCGEGALLLDLRESGVPSVGIDANASHVARCREEKLLAWAGTWHGLAAQRRKFDGVHVALDRWPDESWRAEFGPMLEILAETLLPRGRMVLRGPENLQELLAPCLPGPLELREVFGSTVVLTRSADPRTLAVPSGVVLGPYADAFVGREAVLEIGSGAGQFLDSLKVRDIPCAGLEEHPEFVARCQARGLEVDQGTVARLRDRADHHGGIYLGNAVDKLDVEHTRKLLALCLHLLRPEGCVLVRAKRQPHDPGPCDPGTIRSMCSDLGFVSLQSGVLPGDSEDCFVLAMKDRRSSPAAESLLDGVADIHLDTRADRVNAPLRDLYDLERFERKVFSQGGEDGVLEAIFEHVGVTDRYYVEFGCGDGVQCNTAYLRRQGWTGLLMDGMAHPAADDAVIHKEWIAAENINDLFAKHGVPDEFDLMSIDIDGNDYWVWDAIRHQPRVVVAEYNANLAVDESLTLPYNAEHQWDGSDFYGASLRAFEKLGRKKGYTLLYCSQAGVNAFFVRGDLLRDLPSVLVSSIYRPPNYWYRGYRQYPDLGRSWVGI